MTDISESKESVKQELEGSVDFVVGVLVFGAVVFAVLFNLCFLAVENDVAVKRAYLVVSHPELSTPAQLEEALTQLTELLLDDVRDGGRPVLCEEDEALFSLSPHLRKSGREQLKKLLELKTGKKDGWHRLYLEKLPSARSPFRMPFLELSLLYYSWVIEVATIIFLSQSLRKPHVQESLYHALLKRRYFLPLVSLLLVVPGWHLATLLYPRSAGMKTGIFIALVCLGVASVSHKMVKIMVTPQKMNELGFHLLISSLFVQLLTVMGDPDVVYSVFGAYKMVPLRYLSWFIILCYPLMLMEKYYKFTRRGPAETSE